MNEVIGRAHNLKIFFDNLNFEEMNQKQIMKRYQDLPDLFYLPKWIFKDEVANYTSIPFHDLKNEFLEELESLYRLVKDNYKI